MIPERVESNMKPVKGHLIESDFFRWPTQDERLRESTGLHVICVTGYKGQVSFSNSIRTSWVERAFESDEGRFIETRNSVYSVDMDDTMWKVLQNELKHEKLDVERMKK